MFKLRKVQEAGTRRPCEFPLCPVDQRVLIFFKPDVLLIMSTETEDQHSPSSSAKEISIEEEWAAALAEQNQAEAEPPPLASPTTTATPVDQLVSSSSSSKPKPTAVQGDQASTEVTLDDEWAAALAEQNQAMANPIPSASLTSNAETEDQSVSLSSESPSLAVQDNQPSTEATLDDEWAAALAEQNQEDSSPDQDISTSFNTTDETSIAPPPTPETERSHSSSETVEDNLENDWAEVLQDQKTNTFPETGKTSAVSTIKSKDTSPPEPNESRKVQISSSKEPHHSISTEVPRDLPLEEMQALGFHQAADNNPSESADPLDLPAESESTSQDSAQVLMNWPNTGQTQAQPEPVPSEWTPTRLSSTMDHSDKTVDPTQAQSIEPMESIDGPGRSPTPEESLAVTAAETSIHAAMESATQVGEVIQNQDVKDQSQDASSESSVILSEETSEGVQSAEIEEPRASSEDQNSEGLPQHPEPPDPETGILHVDEAPDRFRRPFFTGSGGSLFGMFTMNTLLTLLTFGVYSFWGRVKIRRYLHSQTKFAGARLAFHGTGGELFKGWMKAVGIFGIPYSALNYAGSLQTEATFQWSVNILAGLIILCFIPIAIVGSHRYRMTRTSWRGIYFSFRHSAKDFLTLYLKGTILSILTLGVYFPVFDNAKRAFLVSGTHFGSRGFGFDGETKELGSIYFKTFRLLVLALVTAEAILLAASFLSGQLFPNQVIDIVFWSAVAMVSLVIPFAIGLWFWFQAARQRYMWSHTTFGPSRFRATMMGKDLFELKITNLLLLVFTLGLAWPWVQTRNLQFLYYHVGLQGSLNLKQIVQESGTASPMGEELAGFFDTGFDLG